MRQKPAVARTAFDHRKAAILVLILPLAILCLASFSVTNVHAPPGASYTIGTSPATLNEQDGNVIITFAISGVTANSAYTFRFTVTKPGSAGQAYCDESFTTNSTGGYTQVLTYPNNSPSWTATSGTVQTDFPGNYNVTVAEIAPKAVTGLPSAKFTVTNRLTVSIISPIQGNIIQRETSANFVVTVYDVNSQPVTNAQVAVTSSGSGQISLSPTTPAGTYSGSYRVQRSDPLGNWNITAIAYSPTPVTTQNFGSYAILTTVTPSQLVVSSLSTYNEYGTPTADFSPGDTVYATFNVGYPTGGYLTNGTLMVQVEDPSGATSTTLSSIYDPNRNLFYTPSGFTVSTSDAAGSWELVFPSGSLSDAYGNSGPSTTITYRFVVHQPQSPTQQISPFYFMIAALAIGGSLGTAVFFKRFNSTTGPFDDLFKLTGGELQPPSTLMISSDSGAGSTTLALQLLQRDLSHGKSCGLLSYDAFPAEITKRMRDMGWEISEYAKTGQLKILDCYSALAGVEGSLIKDPTDFTEVSIQVTRMIENAKGPMTILLDSVTPIFNSAAAKDCINFLQVIGAKVKNSGGIFIFTATKGSVPEEARSKIEALADGVIELNLVKTATSLKRTLQVKKTAGHQSSPVETRFEIVQGKGIMIRKQRVPIGLLR